MWQKLLTKILWALKPVVEFIDKTFTLPDIIKKVDGLDYYRWKDKFKPGMAFLSETDGEGSNLMIPGPLKHGSIYFGYGLKTELQNVINALSPDNFIDSKRISDFVSKYNIKDNIPYVIEAVDAGVIATDDISFVTHKDRFKGFYFSRPIMSPAECDELMKKAALMAILSVGLPYDYGFTDDEQARYCFELVALAYKKVCPDVDLPEVSTLGYLTYQATTFLDSRDFTLILDSESN